MRAGPARPHRGTGVGVGIRDRLRELLHEAPDEAEAVEFELAWWHWGRLKEIAAAVTARLDEAGRGRPPRGRLAAEDRAEHLPRVLAARARGPAGGTLRPLVPPARPRGADPAARLA